MVVAVLNAYLILGFGFDLHDSGLPEKCTEHFPYELVGFNVRSLLSDRSAPDLRMRVVIFARNMAWEEGVRRRPGIDE